MHGPADGGEAIAAAVETFDLRAPPVDFHLDPYPYYRALRRKNPVLPMPDGSFFLTSYADLNLIYRDTKTYSSDKRIEFTPKYGESPLLEHHTTSLVFNDPPLHTRVRRLLTGALTPRAIAAMEEGLVDLVDRLIAPMEERAEIDLIADFASAIPIEVIGNLLAVPHEERGPLRAWSLAILGALEPRLTAAQQERGNAAVLEFLAYLRGLVARRRAAPGDPDKDVLTRLIIGEGGESLSEAELLHNCIFILNAGHETTTNLIGNGLALLDQWRGKRMRLLAEPSLIKSAIEEMLRFESSNQLGNRMAVAPSTLSGVDLPAGARLTLCIGGANRDPAQFPDPDCFDIARKPNRHLAFASGAHQCLGMALARLEGRIAISRFLARFPRFSLLPGAVRSPRLRFRGFETLPASLN